MSYLPVSTPRAVLKRPYQVLHVYIPALHLVCEAERAGAGDAARRLEIVDPLFASDASLEGIMRGIAQALTTKDWADRLWLDGLGAALTARIIQRWTNLAGARAERRLPAPAGASDWRIRRAIEFLEARIDESVRLSELGKAVGLSENQISALFRAGLGLPPHRWLMRRRVERACEMLAEPHRTVTDIAQACGFASSQHLATVFHRQIGTTPTLYRKSRLQ